jgi:hypothetical protein
MSPGDAPLKEGGRPGALGALPGLIAHGAADVDHSGTGAIQPDQLGQDESGTALTVRGQ